MAAILNLDEKIIETDLIGMDELIVSKLRIILNDK
jgi:hypothetical protein